MGTRAGPCVLVKISDVRDFVIDDGFHLLGNFSYLRTRKGVKGYLREDNCSVGVAETLSLVGVQHIRYM